MFIIDKLVRNHEEFLICDITNIMDVNIVSDIIYLIFLGYSEGAFLCHEKLTVEDALDYYRLMYGTHSSFFKIFGLLNNKMKLIGYVDFILDIHKHQGEILGIIINKEFRRRGLGTMLLRYAEYKLREWGAKIVIVRITDRNEISKKFFLYNGYRSTYETTTIVDECGVTRVEEVWVKYL